MSVDFQAWLNNPDAERVTLVDLQAYVDGVGVTTFYISSQPYASATLLYDARLISSPTFTLRIPEAFYGRSIAGYGDLSIDNSDGELDDWINHGWDGRSAVVKVGDPSWDIADFQTVLTATSDSIEVQSNSELRIVLFDKTRLLNKELQTSTYSSPSPSDGKLVPVMFGKVYNIKAVLTDPSTLTYNFSSNASQSIDAVYDNGVLLTSGVGYTATPITSTFVLTSSPAGAITVDATTYTTTIGELLLSMLTTWAELSPETDIDTDSLDALDLICDYELGVNFYDRINCIDALDLFSKSFGGYWYFNRTGKLVVKQFNGVGTPIAVISDDMIYGDLEVELLEPPTYKITIGYEKNWTVQDEDGLAGSVTAERRAWLSQEYRNVSQYRYSTLTKHPYALAPEQIDTLITNSTDATTEASRVVALKGVQRYKISVKTFGNALSLELGDTITLIDSRFGFSGGVDCVVIGLTEYYADGKVDLELWR